MKKTSAWLTGRILILLLLVSSYRAQAVDTYVWIPIANGDITFFVWGKWTPPTPPPANPIADSNLKICVNNAGQPTPLGTEWRYITSLSCPNMGVHDLTNIDQLQYLQNLDLAGNAINNGLSLLSNLNYLAELGLHTSPSASNTSYHITWRQEVAPSVSTSSFTGRAFHQVVSFNSKLWLIGGSDSGMKYNDVWSSSSGQYWTNESNAAAFSARNLHQVVVFGGKLWLIGGQDNQGLKNDVWWSQDGKTWTQATAAAAFSPRKGHQVVVFNNSLWVIGGRASDGVGGTVVKNDIWSSPDGISWTQQTAAANFPPRDSHQVVYVSNNNNSNINSKLWLVGGRGASGDLNDVWSSLDGINWTSEISSANYSQREFHQVVVFKERLWLFGGSVDTGTDQGVKGDVWSSTNGRVWTKEGTPEVFGPFTARFAHQAVVFNNKLWLFGGKTDAVNAINSGYLNDIWRSISVY